MQVIDCRQADGIQMGPLPGHLSGFTGLTPEQLTAQPVGTVLLGNDGRTWKRFDGGWGVIEAHTLPGVPVQAAALLAVCVFEPVKWAKGTSKAALLFDPAASFDINDSFGGKGSMTIGEVTRDSYGVYMAHVNRADGGRGSFVVGNGRMTRAAMALRIASRLAGLTVQRREWGGTGEVLETSGAAWWGGVAA